MTLFRVIFFAQIQLKSVQAKNRVLKESTNIFNDLTGFIYKTDLLSGIPLTLAGNACCIALLLKYLCLN